MTKKNEQIVEMAYEDMLHNFCDIIPEMRKAKRKRDYEKLQICSQLVQVYASIINKAIENDNARTKRQST